MQFKKNNYVIVNLLSAENRCVENNVENGLIGSILTFLFMKNPEKTTCSEKAVVRFLAKLGIDLTKHHRTFGDVKQLLTRECVQKGYFCIQKVQNAEDNEVEWSWGERAAREFSKTDCLQTYCKIYRDVFPPETMVAHFEAAKCE